jgi:hypothetical protein
MHEQTVLLGVVDAVDNEKLLAEMVWPHFWVIRELVRVISDMKSRN